MYRSLQSTEGIDDVTKRTYDRGDKIFARTSVTAPMGQSLRINGVKGSKKGSWELLFFHIFGTLKIKQEILKDAQRTQRASLFSRTV